jgi:hypothetical protein
MATQPTRSDGMTVTFEIPLIGRLNRPNVPTLISLYPKGVAVALWPGPSHKKVQFDHLTALCAEYGFDEQHVYWWTRVPNPTAYLTHLEIQNSLAKTQPRRVG